MIISRYIHTYTVYNVYIYISSTAGMTPSEVLVTPGFARPHGTVRHQVAGGSGVRKLGGVHRGENHDLMGT